MDFNALRQASGGPNVREQMGAASQMQQYLAGEGGEGGGHQMAQWAEAYQRAAAAAAAANGGFVPMHLG
eukprot:CAMPEP_0172199476 /NCGR_PEP_ID=MMETSP1050-20130122/28716_1 /TAXON_ID=233186 /ORGANISM="Cryptomonas curvata, Strain CCAP979/52" /LENGTH=68 /DNA_ID=CAMNT_0012876517 /DNA_START=179 /DNA_END=381 /DNA_ORIENTATION=-